MRTGLKIVVVSLAVLFAVCAAVYAQGDVKVMAVKGQPEILKAGAKDWAACVNGMAVENGDRIRTAMDEFVDISFERGNKNIINIAGNSDVFIKRGSAPYSVELLRGELMALVKSLPKGSTFEVRTPAGLSGSRGTGWRSETDGARATFSAFENSIYTKGIDASGKEIGELIVDSGFKASMERFERPEKLEAISERDMERWNSWKEDVASRVRETPASKEMSLGRAESISRKGGIDLEKAESRQEKVAENRMEERSIDATEGRDSTSSREQGGGGTITH